MESGRAGRAPLVVLGLTLEAVPPPRRSLSATLRVVDDAALLIDAAPRTFFGVPGWRDIDLLDVQVAFLGVPYDGGTPQPGIPVGSGRGLRRSVRRVGTSSLIRGRSAAGRTGALRVGMTWKPIATTWSE